MKGLRFKFKWFIWYFIHFKVRMIGYTKPKIITLTDTTLVAKLPLTRRTKNHLNSMYFGALAVGADMAGGLHGFWHAAQSKESISLAFKSFQAEFIKRPESAVYFVSNQGQTIADMIIESKTTKTRINQPIKVEAFINYPENPDKVADFTLTLSIKTLS